MKKIMQTAAAGMIMLCMLTLLYGCGKNTYEEFSGFYFDTFINIKVYDCEAGVIDGARSICAQYDALFDKDTSGSDVQRINSAAGQPTEVSKDTAELLQVAQEYSAVSEGLFDVTCGALTELWDFTAQSPHVPDKAAINAALQTVGSDKMTVNGTTVTLAQGTKIDLGGIAKGYIADKLAEYLRSCGVENAVINLGGNVVVIGDKFGSGYRIGIQSPFDNSNIDAVTVSDSSVVTAGTYQRGFTQDGVYYHHILDLGSGMPADNGLASVTVVCESSTEGDALATTFLLMGAERGLAAAEQTEGIEAIFITDGGEVLKTSGLE